MDSLAMDTPTFDQYLAFRRCFAVSREMVAQTLAWAEPLAREALGVHAQRDQMNMGEALQYIPVMTTAANNGGWGELMPVWFKPYERPLPLFILDNWAMLALLWQYWLGDVGSAYTIENLLKIFVGGDLLIPFLPKVQGSGRFLQHGALAIFLGTLWLEPESRQAFLSAIETGAQRFAHTCDLRQQHDLSEFMGRVEFEAFFIAEGGKIGGDDEVRAFLANEAQVQTYAALFGGLCFSLAALYDWYGPDWETWVFQKVNLDYRLARFGLEAWAKWLDIPYVEPPPDPAMNSLFRMDNHG
jgi:hypothetical protein